MTGSAKGRKITSHKGGRTARLIFRITPTDRDRLQSILDARGLSLADWVAEKISQESPPAPAQAQTSPAPHPTAAHQSA